MKTTEYRTSSPMKLVTSDIWATVPAYQLQVRYRIGNMWTPVTMQPSEYLTFGNAARIARAVEISSPGLEVKLFQKDPEGEYWPLAEVFQKLFKRIEMTVQMPDGSMLSGGTAAFGGKRAIQEEPTGQIVGYVEP